MSAPRSGEPRFQLPGRLPEGERILWQGAPDWRALARHGLHLRGLAAYLAVLVVSVGVTAALRGEPAGAVATYTARAAAASAVPVGLGLVYAWLAARNAAYTITNRRVVIRLGVALQMTLNLPFAQIEAADILSHSDGTGDVALRTVREAKGLGWVILWPHARPWRLAQAQPMLRAVPDAARAGHILARALAEYCDMPVSLASATGKVDSPECHHGATTVAA